MLAVMMAVAAAFFLEKPRGVGLSEGMEGNEYGGWGWPTGTRCTTPSGTAAAAGGGDGHQWPSGLI